MSGAFRLMASRFAPPYLTRGCSGGLGAPNSRNPLFQRRPFFFISKKFRSPYPVKSRPKPLFICKIFFNDPLRFSQAGLSPGAYRTPRIVCPRFSAFFAALAFLSASYPHISHRKRSLLYLPVSPQLLHSALIPLPNTSTISTECSRHFCLSLSRISPFLQTPTE